MVLFWGRGSSRPFMEGMAAGERQFDLHVVKLQVQIDQKYENGV